MVDFDALAGVPRTGLSAAATALLATGVVSAPADPTPLVRLLHRARSRAIPCLLIAPMLGENLVERLGALRLPHLFSAAVSATESLADGINPFRQAALHLDISSHHCLAIAPGGAKGPADTSGAKLLISRSGSIEHPTQPPPLSPRPSTTSRSSSPSAIPAIPRRWPSPSPVPPCAPRRRS
ncbi:hypothetical protein [Kitasatospora sp. NPDC057015]|uniref:hypothetical protein n=1 Tax=Kitasatospora sp. NPDC057015 TaxID=3346001 RepID=UPI0036426482